MPLPLAAHTRGHNGTPARPFVFIHGLTFDHRMWDPVLDALPPWRRALAVDLPGHGASPALDDHRPEAVAAAVHETVLAAGIENPVLIGHSMGALLATVYAAEYGAAALVNVDMAARPEPFTRLVHALGPQLRGDGFPRVWEAFRASMHAERLPAEARALLRAGDVVPQERVVSYWATLLDTAPGDVLMWIDGLVDCVRDIPYLALFGTEPEAEERAWLATRVPAAEIAVWDVGHHFPHLADPDRFAAVLTGFSSRLAEPAAR